jgi:PadR family transcriptional regulator, regulatory protein PadR
MTDLRWLSQVKRGLLELCILNLLHQDSMYGYQLVKRLTSVPGLVAGAGTVYPLLSRLKREGLLTSSLVESPAGPARRTYVLTVAGRRHMRSINEAWRQIAAAVNEFMAEENAQRT